MQYHQFLIKQLDSPILAITPVQQKNAIIILTEQANLYHFEFESEQLQYITQIALPYLKNKEEQRYKYAEYQLYSSVNGLYIAVVVNYGQYGLVLNTKTGNIILNLDGGDYCENTVPFSFAFTQIEQEDIVIYRSDWNRLESYNLSQNKSTTVRVISPYNQQEAPEHYLNYFHGALYISPDQQYILDNGWLWHPVSVPKIWSLLQWLDHNPFESEDGNSLKSLFYRDSWHYPICWLDNDTIALWHIELWDEYEFDLQPQDNRLGIHLYSLSPEKPDRLWKMPEQTQTIFSLYTDQNQLIIVGSENISLYNISEQKLIKQFPNQRKQKQHLIHHCLFSFQDKTLYQIDYTAYKT